MGLISCIFYLGGLLFVLIWVTFTLPSELDSKMAEDENLQQQKTVKMTSHGNKDHGPQFWD